MIELRDVSKIYTAGKTKVNALVGVNFLVNQGEFIIIKGPSGSGKSTLLNILGLLDAPSTGHVYLKDQKVTFDDFDALAETRSQYISFIFQAFNLNPVLTLEENIMVPLMIRRDLTKAEKKKRVIEWIRNVGLENHKNHRPEELSGGQRQRVAIARAMVSMPELVIADEPTANLDSKTASVILELMQSVNKQRGTAFVFATHDSLLENYASTIRHIKDGRLTEDPSPI